MAPLYTTTVPSEVVPENTFRILVATDLHLGYQEKDAERGKDSIDAFEEVLQIACAQNVDFLLLGGDLFHENKPSRTVMYDCVNLLRKHCMNDRPVSFKMVSDAAVNFGHSLHFHHVNFEDEHLNVGLPVFSINGNHDDISGSRGLCALDVLHSNGLINFFGKYGTQIDEIEVVPLLMQKGTTKLAIYGIGAIRDERLYRLFETEKVRFARPIEEPDSWYGMFVVHQNRAKHGDRNYLPEHFVPSFLDCVVWGHEHNCIDVMEPCKTTANVTGPFILQPGSTVVTALNEAEALSPKSVFLLSVVEKQVRVERIELQSVRQFFYEDVSMDQSKIDPLKHDCAKRVEAYLTEKVNMLLDKAEQKHNGRQPKKPLIRLRVDYSGGYETVNPQRFGQKFADRIANPRDLLLFHRHREQQKQVASVDKDAMSKVFRGVNAAGDGIRVEDLVRSYFLEVGEKDKMSLLSDRGLVEATKAYVDKDEKDAVKLLVEHQIDKIKTHLKESKCNSMEEIVALLEKRRRDHATIEQQRRQKDGTKPFVQGEDDDDDESAEAERILSQARANKRAESGRDENDSDVVMENADDEETLQHLSDSDNDSGGGVASRRGRASASKSTRARAGRGRGRGRGSADSTAKKPATRGRGSRGGRSAKVAAAELSDEDSQAVKRPARSTKKSYIDGSDDEAMDTQLTRPSPRAGTANSSLANSMRVYPRNSDLFDD